MLRFDPDLYHLDGSRTTSATSDSDEANTEQWLSHETLPEARAKAMRRVAELCARTGEKIYAVQLLRRAADQQNESRAKQISRWQGARGRSMSIMKKNG